MGPGQPSIVVQPGTKGGGRPDLRIRLLSHALFGAPHSKSPEEHNGCLERDTEVARHKRAKLAEPVEEGSQNFRLLRSETKETDELCKKIRPLSGGQGWLRPQRSFTGCGEGMIMQSLKRSLRFRWSSSQMEANLEASDLTAIELPPTYLRAFHSLIALDSSSTFLLCRVRVFFVFLPITGLKRWVKATVKLSL